MSSSEDMSDFYSSQVIDINEELVYSDMMRRGMFVPDDNESKPFIGANGKVRFKRRIPISEHRKHMNAKSRIIMSKQHFVKTEIISLDSSDDEIFPVIPKPESFHCTTKAECQGYNCVPLVAIVKRDEKRIKIEEVPTIISSNNQVINPVALARTIRKKKLKRRPKKTNLQEKTDMKTQKDKDNNKPSTSGIKKKGSTVQKRKHKKPPLKKLRFYNSEIMCTDSNDSDVIITSPPVATYDISDSESEHETAGPSNMFFKPIDADTAGPSNAIPASVIVTTPSNAIPAGGIEAPCCDIPAGGIQAPRFEIPVGGIQAPRFDSYQYMSIPEILLINPRIDIPEDVMQEPRIDIPEGAFLNHYIQIPDGVLVQSMTPMLAGGIEAPSCDIPAGGIQATCCNIPAGVIPEPNIDASQDNVITISSPNSSSVSDFNNDILFDGRVSPNTAVIGDTADPNDNFKNYHGERLSPLQGRRRIEPTGRLSPHPLNSIEDLDRHLEKMNPRKSNTPKVTKEPMTLEQIIKRGTEIVRNFTFTTTAFVLDDYDFGNRKKDAIRPMAPASATSSPTTTATTIATAHHFK